MLHFLKASTNVELFVTVNVLASLKTPTDFSASVNENRTMDVLHASHCDTVSGAPSSRSTVYCAWLMN